MLSAEVQIVDGLVTGTLLDVPTDAGKVAALARAGVIAPDVVFAGWSAEAAEDAGADSHRTGSDVAPASKTARNVRAWRIRRLR